MKARKATKGLPKFIPIPTPPLPLPGEEPEEFGARTKAHAAHAAAVTPFNLNLLFGYFGITKTGDPAVDYGLLAMCLAKKYIRSFHSEAKRGARKKDPLRLARLLVDAHFVERRFKFSDNDSRVAKELREKSLYKHRWEHYDKGTLQNMLTAARDPKRAPFPWLLQENADFEGAQKILAGLSNNHEKTQLIYRDTFLSDPKN